MVEEEDLVDTTVVVVEALDMVVEEVVVEEVDMEGEEETGGAEISERLTGSTSFCGEKH